MAINFQQPLDSTFHALGDSTRRGILSMLAKKGAQSANELRAPFDVAQPTISKHLKVLEKAGLVSREIDGRTHRFHLEVSPMTDATNWIQQHRVFWEGTLKNLGGFMAGMDKQESSK